MPRPVLTFSDLEKIPAGGEVSIPAGTLITALAADEAARRSITIKLTEPSADSQPSAMPSTSFERITRLTSTP